jgi:hypothetical protein
MLQRFVMLLALLAFVVTPALAEAQYQVTPDGRIVMNAKVDGVDFTDLIESFPAGRNVTFCLHSTSEFGIDWYWELQGVKVDEGLQVLGGFIKGTICDAPNWDVSGGTIYRFNLVLQAFYVGGESCAGQLDMIGDRTPPALLWSGTYGWWGANDQFPHSTSFYSIGPCP